MEILKYCKHKRMQNFRIRANHEVSENWIAKINLYKHES